MQKNNSKFLKFNLIIVSLVLLFSTALAEQNLNVIDLVRSGDKYETLYKMDKSKLSDQELAQIKQKIESEKQTEEKSWAEVGNNCFTVLCDVAIIYIPLSMCI
jgi:hypothetical protein